MGRDVRRHIRRRIRPHKRLCHFHRHPLLRHRSPQPPITPFTHRTKPGNLLLFDVAAHAEHVDSVQALEVVAHVEFVEAQWDVERGIAGWEEGGADEGDCEVGAAKVSNCNIIH